jgi:hypothetical protein
MNLKIYSSALILSLLISFLCIRELKAQSGGQEAETRQLQDSIFHYDSLFWKAYNSCDLDKMDRFFSEDLEFYHDKGGLTLGRENLRESVEKGLCGNESFRLRREQVNGSLQLYPLYQNGIVYGAILSGEHIFFIKENGKKEYLDGIARFTHVWLRQEGAWKMSRVLSYGHRPANYNPNLKEEAKVLDGPNE